MTTNNPSPTRSTNKANSYLQARRRGRRHLNASVDLQSEEKGGTESAVSTQEVAESTTPPPDSSGERHQDQTEKAYKYLAQRRAKRRNRCLVSAQPENAEESSPTIPRNQLNPPAQNMVEPQRLIVLVSNGVSDRTQASNQSRARTLLQSKGTPHVEVDGMDPNQKERRDYLFGISGIRASYPQFFLEQKDGTTTFVGTWDVIEGINDSSSYPDETIEAHPELRTWDRVFVNLVSSFE